MPAVPLSPAVAAIGGDGYKSLYSFAQNGKAGDGNRPVADLIAIGGEFYGTTQYGGTTNAQCALGCGIVFAVSAAGKERILYRFKGGNDGAAPLGSVIALGGFLYGTTSMGGNEGACSGGCGTVFKLSVDGTSEQILHRFAGGSDGARPAAGLARLGGAFFGTTQMGGKATPLCSTGCGTVFKVSSNGAEKVVYRFEGGSDGAYPVSHLLSLNSKLYGTTQYGGKITAFCAIGCGTLFRVGADGSKKTLHLFSYGPASGDGAYPAAAPATVGGELYGTTVNGGSMSDGTVYQVSLTTGAEKVLHAFSCCQSSSDGSFPVSHLVTLGGALYGTTRNGGTSAKGIIFSITPQGAESVRYDFAGVPAGANPQAGLTVSEGTLYGTTSAGGSASEGTVFSFTP